MTGAKLIANMSSVSTNFYPFFPLHFKNYSYECGSDVANSFWKMKHLNSIANANIFSTPVLSLQLFENYLLAQALHGKIGVDQYLVCVGQISTLPTQLYSKYTNRLLCQPESS